MIRDWFKTLLKEVFSDDIEVMHHNYLEKKFGDVVENEIKDILAPLREDAIEFQRKLRTQLKDIDKSITVELNGYKNIINDALSKTAESLPKKLESLELNVDGLGDVLNNKVKSIVSTQITKSDDSYSRNVLVIAVKDQFKNFVNNHDFVGGMCNKSVTKTNDDN